MAAGPALVLGWGADPLPLETATSRADEAGRPAQLLDHRPAQLLAAVGIAELRLAQPADLRRQLSRHPTSPAKANLLRSLHQSRCLSRLFRKPYIETRKTKRLRVRTRMASTIVK